VALRDTQDCLIIEVPTVGAGQLRDTQDCLIFEIPAPIVSIAYPLTPPVALKPQDVTMRMVNLIGENVSPFVGSQNEQQWPGQWFELEASLRPMLRADYEAVVGFLGALNGKYGTFLFGDRNAKTPQGVATGTPLVNGAVASLSNQIPTKGWTALINGILKAGDYMQITTAGGPQRLYKLLFDMNSDAAGHAVATVFPTVREALTDGLAITLNSTAGTFRLMENSLEWKIARTRSAAISFKAREAF
jgi:hypothetical protein